MKRFACFLLGVFIAISLSANQPEWFKFNSNPRVRAILSTDDVVYIVHSDGLIVFHKDTKEYRAIPEKEIVSGIIDSWSVYPNAIIDNNDNLWIAAREGLNKYDGEKFEFYKFEFIETLQDIYFSSPILYYNSEKDLIYWLDFSVSTNPDYDYYFFAEFNPKTGEFRDLTEALPTEISNPKSFEVSLDGSLWIAHESKLFRMVDGAIIDEFEIDLPEFENYAFDCLRQAPNGDFYVSAYIETNNDGETSREYDKIFRFDGENFHEVSFELEKSYRDIFSFEIINDNAVWIFSDICAVYSFGLSFSPQYLEKHKIDGYKLEYQRSYDWCQIDGKNYTYGYWFDFDQNDPSKFYSLSYSGSDGMSVLMLVDYDEPDCSAYDIYDNPYPQGSKLTAIGSFKNEIIVGEEESYIWIWNGEKWRRMETGIPLDYQPQILKSFGDKLFIYSEEYGYMNTFEDLEFGTSRIYDGENVIDFKRETDFITDVAADKDGDLWILGFDGKRVDFDLVGKKEILLELSGNNIYNYNPGLLKMLNEHFGWSIDPNEEEFMNSFAFDEDGILWMSLRTHLVAINTEDFSIIDSVFVGQKLKKLIPDETGIWGVDDNSVYYYDGESLKHYYQTLYHFEGFVDAELDCDGFLWIGTAESGLIRTDGDNWEFFTEALTDLFSDEIIDLTTDNNGNLWICHSGGISVYKNCEISTVEFPRAGISQMELGVFPNPTTESADILFALPESISVSLKIYDLYGREVATLVYGFREAGRHEARFDATGLPSGVYLIELIAGEVILTEKIINIK